MGSSDVQPDGRVVSIHIAAEDGGALVGLDVAELAEGQGIVGDRHRRTDGDAHDAQVSLVEAERIKRFADSIGYPLRAADTRRNIVTSGTALNDLVGHRFCVGEVELVGTGLAEPCGYLARKLIDQFDMHDIEPRAIVRGLIHAAGLYARILRGGPIRPGDGIRKLD
jgi:MOSC domain-containing protein YiiM